MTSPKLFAAFCSCAMIVIGGCTSQQQRTVIARVGTNELTLEDARKDIDTSYGSLASQLPRYVSLWTTNELLYQEALRHGVNREESFKERLNATERQMAIQEFLRQTTENDSAYETEPMLREYYLQHASEFVVHEEMMKIHRALFTTREAAGRFIALVSGSNWDAAINNIRNDSTLSPLLASYETNRYYSQRTLLPGELWKIGTSLSNGQTSFPVKTAQGYAIVQKVTSILAGQPAEYDLAFDEVRERCRIAAHRQRYEQLLGTLRQRYTVEVMTPVSAQTESTSIAGPHE